MGLINQNPQTYYDGNVFGNYQFTSLDNIINQFMVVYIGEEKTISKARRVDVAFHAQRALQELSFDTLKSIKAHEITVPATLQMPLPQDYVNYTKMSWVDSAGIKHVLYPTSKTSNPNNFNNYAQNNPLINSDGDFKLTVSATITSGSTTVVLDTLNKDIQIGDKISGPSIGSWVVYMHEIDSGVSVLTLSDTVSDVINNTPNFFGPATSDLTETLTITRADGKLKYKSISVVSPAITGTPWVPGSNIITFDNASDTAGIQVGMVINPASNYTHSFPAGTTVIGVNGKYLTMSTTATFYMPTSSDPLHFSIVIEDSDAWSNYKSGTPSENQDDYIDDTYWPVDGSRFGLDPQHAQANGSFYIDHVSGKIHFSSNISGKTVILDYISDSLGTDGEMQVHKFAEEAMYKSIIYAILSMRANTPEYIVRRFKKERFAAIRTAKLRLSNVKLEEITQILRGKSKQIKH